ncbi:hypothetical protein GCM10023187_12670 [Nibrella viscosa]|uniref:Uncharacterized protein n=1 Tax=Nibrella viscosa TaxID=1084524 RepID=A0ABP8K422_9BACT
MLTLNTILEELKDIPVNRLEDLYSLIHSLRADTKKSGAAHKQILSYAGSFRDMSQEDYDSFVQTYWTHRFIDCRNSFGERLAACD